jgi:hypothetical protein
MPRRTPAQERLGARQRAVVRAGLGDEPGVLGGFQQVAIMGSRDLLVDVSVDDHHL